LSPFRRDPGRPLTPGERDLAAVAFGKALDPEPVRIHAAKWWPFQPRRVTMAPDGHIWFHPQGGLYCEDFAARELGMQAFLIHELTHVWQHQQGIRLWVRRHPFCRYDYRIEPGKPLRRYGIEQQAMIVEHSFIARQSGAPDPALEAVMRDAGLGPSGTSQASG